MKIVLSSMFYPMSISRYFEAALKRRDDIELVTVGPFSGSWIPWNNGMNLPMKYAKKPDIAFSAAAGNQPPTMPTSFVETQLPWKADLWIQIDAGFHLSEKPTHGKNIIVGTDPHVLPYDKQRTLADTFYCMQKFYAKEGDEYLPYAYDPIWHAPDKKQPLNFDACLLGLHYQQRNQLIDALRRNGIDVYYDLGPVFDEARALYNQAPIGLNWSSLQDLTARVFELLGMRRLAVVNRVPDLENFFEDGKHLIAFDSLPQAVESVVHYVENSKEATKIANAGHKAVKPHTWDARIDQILEAI